MKAAGVPPLFAFVRRLAFVGLVILVAPALWVTIAASAGPGSDVSASARKAPTPRVLEEVPATSNSLAAAQAHNSAMLAADPTEPRFVVMASRLDAPDFSCELHLSGDGGRGWVPANPVPRLPKGAEKCYGPEVAFDRRGKLYYLFVGLVGRGNEPMGAFLTTSSDRGRTFTAPRKILGPFNFQVRMAIERDFGSRGRIHLVWLKASGDPGLGSMPPPPNPIMAAHSDDGGKTFSKPVQVSDLKRDRVVAPALALGPSGGIHVLYYDLGDDARDYNGLEGPVWEGKWSLVATSSAGGRGFARGVVVDDAIAPPERMMLIFTMPPPSEAAGPDGRLFAAWHDARNGDWDVFLSVSKDNGRSWTGPRRLNDDPVGNGRNQYLPRLSVSSAGRLDAIFYDRRDDPSNIRNNVYYTYSSNSMSSFSPNLRLTRKASDTRSGQRYQGAAAAGLVDFGARIALL
ncbi:MAG: sialidase family protein, partial [Actinomycetota bacterium]